MKWKEGRGERKQGFKGVDVWVDSTGEKKGEKKRNVALISS